MEMSEVITSPIFLDNNESNQLPINIEVSSSSYSTFNITPSLRLGPVFASYLKEGRWQLCWSDWSTGIIAFYPSNSLITFSEPNQSKLKPHPELLKKRIGNEQLLQIPTGNNNKQKRSRGKISYLPKSQCFFMKRVNLTIMSFNSSQFSSSNNNNLGEANKTQDNSSNEVCSELLLNIINNESNSIEIENKVKIENEICEKKELENDPSSFSSLSYHNNIKEEFGIVIKCQNSDNYDIYFRCILRKDQVLDLKKFIEDCAESIKIEELSLDPVQACEEISVSANKSFISPSHSTSNSFMNSVSESTSSFIFFSSTSLFNATIGPFMSSMSSNERVSSKRKILSRDVESKSKRKTSLDCLHPDDCQNDTNSPILNSTQILKSNFSKVSKLSSKVSPLKKIKKKKKYWNFSFFNYGNNKIKSIDNQEADKLINEVLSAVQDNLTAANTLESVHPTVESLPTSNTPKSSFNLSQGKSKLNSLASPVSNYSYSLSSPSYSNICQSPGLSSMRRAISRAMDRHERDTRGNILKTRRGTFKWLPLYSYGHSDLVIGSWFFVIGSIGAIFTSLIVILNRYYGFLGVFDDGAGLTKMEFVSSWVLLAISSFFSTVGSLAFVRAFHCDPPMRPLFQQKYLNRINEINQMNLKWEYDYLIKNYYEMTKFNEKNESIDYSMIENLKNSLDITIPDPPKRRNLYYHIQSDELLASWLFLLATIPFIPYSLIYLFGDPHSEYTNLYIAGFFGAILCNLGSLLFVKACYPSDNVHQDLLLPITKALFGKCLSLEFMLHYVSNDWLGASWIFLWTSWISCFGTLVLFIIKCGKDDQLAAVIYGTGFIENLLFVIGGAYFVAGSYDMQNINIQPSVNSPINNPVLSNLNEEDRKHIHYEERLKNNEHLWLKRDSLPRHYSLNEFEVKNDD